MAAAIWKSSTVGRIKYLFSVQIVDSAKQRIRIVDCGGSVFHQIAFRFSIFRLSFTLLWIFLSLHLSLSLFSVNKYDTFRRYGLLCVAALATTCNATQMAQDRCENWNH